MISLTVDLRVRPGHLAPFLAAITENALVSFSDEPGCVRFDVSQDVVDDHHFTFYELYVDPAALHAHRAAPHFTAWRRAAEEHVEPGSQVNVTGTRLLHHGGTQGGQDGATTGTAPAHLLVDPADVEPFDRGNGVTTVPYVGVWNCRANRITTGQTHFEAGTGLELHSHNVEESVLVLEGAATAQVGEQTFELGADQATWVAAGVPHRFENRGAGVLRIYWVYGGRDVTRTTTATGETFQHLSARDTGGRRTS